jgi:CDP-diacylglycerol--glycerol-3-phosphate 3-phosphatidyltransferase
MFGRIGGQALRCATRRPIARRNLPGRKFSHAAANASAAPAPSPLGGITVELDRIAPRFEISASQVTILNSPAQFYSTLKVRDPVGSFILKITY